MLSTTVKRRLATALSGAAIAGIAGAPTASAMPTENVGPSRDPGDVQIVAPPPRPSTPSATGFDLSSAAIGAAAGTGLLIVVLAGGGMAWGRPINRRHGAAGA